MVIPQLWALFDHVTLVLYFKVLLNKDVFFKFNPEADNFFDNFKKVLICLMKNGYISYR